MHESFSIIQQDGTVANREVRREVCEPVQFTRHEYYVYIKGQKSTVLVCQILSYNPEIV